MLLLYILLLGHKFKFDIMSYYLKKGQDTNKMQMTFSTFLRNQTNIIYLKQERIV